MCESQMPWCIPWQKTCYIYTLILWKPRKVFVYVLQTWHRGARPVVTSQHLALELSASSSSPSSQAWSRVDWSPVRGILHSGWYFVLHGRFMTFTCFFHLWYNYLRKILQLVRLQFGSSSWLSRTWSCTWRGSLESECVKYPLSSMVSIGVSRTFNVSLQFEKTDKNCWGEMIHSKEWTCPTVGKGSSSSQPPWEEMC